MNWFHQCRFHRFDMDLTRIRQYLFHSCLLYTQHCNYNYTNWCRQYKFPRFGTGSTHIHLYLQENFQRRKLVLSFNILKFRIQLVQSISRVEHLIWNWHHGSKQRLPVSQLSPVKPGAQLQVYAFTTSTQVPPFWHGLDAHSSTSIRKQCQ